MLPAITAGRSLAASTLDDLSIYIHWPFCLKKCPYCDFNSYQIEKIDIALWKEAYQKQIRYFGEITGRRTLSSIYFGGGTPSLMPEAFVGEIIDAVYRAWLPSNDVEITLEANPSSSDFAKFKALRRHGVNRLSLGVQALNDSALRFLGRTHSLADALRSIEWARESFPRMSIDLIYGRPDQSVGAWLAELERAAALDVGHLSAYQLTIEEGTAFHAGNVPVPPEDTSAELYTATIRSLARYGFSPYEISNYARQGNECRHNLAVWRGGDYLGIGPGAHGRIAGDGSAVGFRQEADPRRWLALAGGATGAATSETPISGHELGQELVMTGLRLEEGVTFKAVENIAWLPISSVIDMNEARSLATSAVITLDDQRMRATADGRLLLDEILRRLLVFT